VLGQKKIKEKNRENKRERRGVERKLCGMGKNESTVHCVKISDDPAQHGADERKHIACAGLLLQDAVFPKSKMHRRCRARSADARVNVGVGAGVSVSASARARVDAS